VQSVNWNINHNLPLFDPNSGILTKVEFISNLTGSQHYDFENTGASPGDAIVGLTMWSTIDLPYSRFLTVTSSNSTITPVTSYDGKTDFWGTSGFNFTVYNNSTSTMVYTAPTYNLAYFYATSPGATKNYLTHAKGSKTEDVPGTSVSGVSTNVGSKLCVKYYYTRQPAYPATS
jgi:hypothetical protein